MAEPMDYATEIRGVLNGGVLQFKSGDRWIDAGGDANTWLVMLVSSVGRDGTYRIKPAGVDLPHGGGLCNCRDRCTGACCPSGVTATRTLSDGDIEALYMQFCPDDSLAAAIAFAREVEKRAAGVEATPVADAATKAAYVVAFGSDKGWLGIEGSYFIEGYREGKRAAGVKGLGDAKR